MHVPVIGFIPPIEGINDYFNTFRLGGTWAKKLKPGDEVFIMDEKAKAVIGRATVCAVGVGKLRDMCNQHAIFNHREIDSEDLHHASDRLYAYLLKLFGPHIVNENKLCSVIYMKRIE